MAENIALNAKVQRPGVCNAMETLLVHQGDRRNLPARAWQAAMRAAGVELRGCPRTRRMSRRQAGHDEDWAAEYLDLILAVRVVDEHRRSHRPHRRYGSLHTEAIITRDYANAQRFLREVDSVVVLVNASTRFTDGKQLGLGAEIGITTSKLHAFGPMGLEELTTTKFIVYGEGQVRT